MVRSPGSPVIAGIRPQKASQKGIRYDFASIGLDRQHTHSGSLHSESAIADTIESHPTIIQSVVRQDHNAHRSVLERCQVKFDLHLSPIQVSTRNDILYCYFLLTLSSLVKQNS